MLSPAQHHLLVRRDLAGNLAQRVAVRDAARGDRGFQRELLRMCAEDVLFWINLFVEQFNPKKAGALAAGPFITWDFQDRLLLSRDPARPGLLWCIENGKDLVQEKSRELGVSWVDLLAFDWLALFHDWQKFLCISHTEDAVDRAGDPDSLFWKLAHVHENLPGWMADGVGKRKMGFRYRRTHSVLNGTATTTRAGVGGRARAILCDEFAKQANDTEIWGNTADTAPCRVVCSTHYGLGTEFFRLTRRPDIKKQVVHWSMHPEKNRGLYRWNAAKPGGAGVESLVWDAEAWDVVPAARPHEFPPDFVPVTDGTPAGGPFPGVRSPWYDAECVRRANARQVAMHLDINPTGSTSQFFDPLEIARLVAEHCRPPLWAGDVVFARDTGKEPQLVASPGGPLKLWLTPLKPTEVPARPYVLGADLAAGTGETPSCFCVLDAATGEKVGEYTNAHIKPDAAAGVAVALCHLFVDADGNPAQLIWEKAGPGIVFGNTVVKELAFFSVWFRRDEFKLNPKVSDDPGWSPSPASKRLLLEEYQADLQAGKFLNPSEGALRECLAICYDGQGNVEHSASKNTGDPSAGRVNHADHVIADALADKLRRERGGRAEAAREKGPPPNSIMGRRQRRERQLQEAW